MKNWLELEKGCTLYHIISQNLY